MSSSGKAAGAHPDDLDGTGLRVAVICSRFNDHVTRRVVEGARRGLRTLGVAEADITEVWVAGAFELPFAAKAYATSGRVDALICAGTVIRGETTHYELVAGECARGIQQVQLETGIPVAFGVLTTEDIEQALARSQPEGGRNIGEECAAVAVEMARLRESLSPPSS
jgi:6,7-dimethyl-8-ribityllumazine synthase